MRALVSLRLTILLGLVILATASLYGQRVEVKSLAVVDGGNIPGQGMTVSRNGVEVSFSAVVDEGRLEGYDYRGVDLLREGDEISIHSQKFVPLQALRSDGSLDPADDQFVTVRVASISHQGANIKVDLAEPIEVFNVSVMNHGQRGNAPPPSAMYTSRLMFVRNSDGSFRLVSASKGHGARPSKNEGSNRD